MIVLFGNQKGGCGKSSILLLLANHLAMRNLKVRIIDTDRQRSIYQLKLNQETIEIVDQNPIQVEYQTMDKVLDMDFEEDEIVLIDTANQLNEETIQMANRADKIIVPYNYSKMSFASTLTFIDVLLKLIDKADDKIIPVGSIIKNTAKQSALGVFREYLKDDKGLKNVVEEYFKDTIKVSRISFVLVDRTLIEEFSPVLDEIFNKINKGDGE